MILDINGQEVTEEITDCMVGTEMLGKLVSCTIEKDDLVYKLKLNFGSTTYETRVPYHEFNEEVKKQVWTDMLTNAFANHEIGKQNRGVIAGFKQS